MRAEHAFKRELNAHKIVMNRLQSVGRYDTILKHILSEKVSQQGVRMFFLAAAVPEWVSASFPIIRLVLLIIMVLLSIFMIVAVMMQDANSSGLSSVSGGQDSFFGAKQNGKTFESTMKKVTVGVAIALVVVCVLFSVAQIVYPAGA